MSFDWAAAGYAGNGFFKGLREQQQDARQREQDEQNRELHNQRMQHLQYGLDTLPAPELARAQNEAQAQDALDEYADRRATRPYARSKRISGDALADAQNRLGLAQVQMTGAQSLRNAHDEAVWKGQELAGKQAQQPWLNQANLLNAQSSAADAQHKISNQGEQLGLQNMKHLNEVAQEAHKAAQLGAQMVLNGNKAGALNHIARLQQLSGDPTPVADYHVVKNAAGENIYRFVGAQGNMVRTMTDTEMQKLAGVDTKTPPPANEFDALLNGGTFNTGQGTAADKLFR